MSHYYKEQGKITRKKMMEFIKGYFEEHGYAPSYPEICEGIGRKSQSTVCRHMKILLDEGLLETDLDSWHNARGFRVARQNRTRNT